MTSRPQSAVATSGTFAVPGFFVQAVIAALHQEKLLFMSGRSALSDLAQSDPATLALPRVEFAALLDRACAATGNPALGLLIGQRITESNLHMLGPIIVASQSLRSASEHMDAIQLALFGSVRWRLVERGESAFYEPTTPNDCQPETDLALALTFSCAQRFVGAAHRETLTALISGPPPLNGQTYRQVFGQQLEFDAARTSLRLPRALLDVTRAGTDPALAATLRQMALQRFGTREAAETWTSRLEQALREHTRLAHVDFAKIALRWQLTERGLRRRIELEGTRLLDVLNRIRFERARQQLSESSARIEEVADTLGYSDVSAFARAFKRWSGLTPACFRDQSTRKPRLRPASTSTLRSTACAAQRPTCSDEQRSTQ